VGENTKHPPDLPGCSAAPHTGRTSELASIWPYSAAAIVVLAVLIGWIVSINGGPYSMAECLVMQAKASFDHGCVAGFPSKCSGGSCCFAACGKHVEYRCRRIGIPFHGPGSAGIDLWPVCSGHVRASSLVCRPGDKQTCVSTFFAGSGEQTCAVDGSGYGPCEQRDSGAEE
jgi:hypothetical protein